MLIESERLILRRWLESDKEPFRIINSDPRITEFYPAVCTAEESDQIIFRTERHFDKHGFGLFAVVDKKEDELIGFVGLQNVPFESHFTPTVEIGWRIGCKFWNKGFATEAAGAVLDFGFSKLGMKEIVAMTPKTNIRSRRVMEKLQMTYDLKDDFENPKISEGHHLRPHVLYRLKNKS